ncbi:2,3-bisphosphoglycerate-independent phosphoglycerate mutase [bacterium]|nr:2,3-bisphosphoglycerate-independent phosphoglycerate mutase [candidate division CSSED10-310 bacterium]
MSNVMLVVRDGWGYSEKTEGNAIYHANKPFDDYLLNHTRQALLSCHGENVGLPPGFQGSSEVGHMNMGAGRIVEQEVTRIFRAIQEGSIFKTRTFQAIEMFLSMDAPALHFFGLLQDEGVHAHQEHLFQLLRHFRPKFKGIKIWIHPIADGRDTPPRSFNKFLDRLLREIRSYEDIEIGTVWGRYYGMDRGKNWNLIDIAYRAMVHGEGEKTDDFKTAVSRAYAEDQTPDGVPMFDEYIKPLVNSGYPGMHPGDIIINFNYRQDRAIQISRAFVDSTCPVYRDISSLVHYYGLTRYYNEFDRNIIPPIEEGGSMQRILGEVLSDSGHSQLRISETQKFRHITSFFNGKLTEPFPGEEQVEIPSRYDPSSFASHPEMNAREVTEELLERLNRGYRFILVNYANCDMVGHTGDFDAARRAAGIVDENVRIVSDRALELGYTVLVTADHGNAEQMLDENGEPKTSHTVNPVKLHLLSRPGAYRFGAREGILSDVAPLILKIMGLPIPAEMTSDRLARQLVPERDRSQSPKIFSGRRLKSGKNGSGFSGPAKS